MNNKQTILNEQTKPIKPQSVIDARREIECINWRFYQKICGWENAGEINEIEWSIIEAKANVCGFNIYKHAEMVLKFIGAKKIDMIDNMNDPPKNKYIRSLKQQIKHGDTMSTFYDPHITRFRKHSAQATIK